MREFRWCVLLATCSLCVTVCMTDVEYDGQVILSLSHALDSATNATFHPRGTVNIRSLRSGATVTTQEPLDEEDIWKLKKLVAQDGLYHLQVTAKQVDGMETSLLTFVEACALYESALSDFLTINLDHYGNVLAVSLTTTTGRCEGVTLRESSLSTFNTTVFVRHMEQGPVPDTAAYIQKIEQEKLAKERGDTKDNRSFFTKYWMYIVPVVIFMMLSGAANQEQGGSGGGR